MLLIKHGLVVLEEQTLPEADILVAQDKIVAIEQLDEARLHHFIAQYGEVTREIDATGCVVFPGFIDPHVHMQMTNALTTTADSYATGSVAALYGGNTTIINFATADRGMRLDEVIARELSKASPKCSCNYLFHVEMVDVNEGTLADLETLAKQGVRSCKAYMAYGFRINDGDLYRTVKACNNANMLLEAHCENGDLLDAIAKDLESKNQTSMLNKAKAHPALAEANAINTLSYIGQELDANVHVVHLSSKLGLEEVRNARKRGAKITVETCPQYLYLDQEVYQNEDELEAAKYVCAPIPRTAEDRKAILEALVAGEIQTLATDHCAYRLHGQKDAYLSDFRFTPGGLPGVEERASLCYSKLVADGLISLSQFAQLMSTNSAKLYDLYPTKGVLQVGSDADITIYDPNITHTFTDENIHSACENTVYAGVTVQGKVRDVVLGGEVVLANFQLEQEGKGQYLATTVKPERKEVFKRLS